MVRARYLRVIISTCLKIVFMQRCKLAICDSVLNPVTLSLSLSLSLHATMSTQDLLIG